MKDGNLLAELLHRKYLALIKATGQLSRPNRIEIRERNKAVNRLERKKIVIRDRSARAATGIREARGAAVFQAPAQKQLESHEASAPELSSHRHCYVCN